MSDTSKNKKTDETQVEYFSQEFVGKPFGTIATSLFGVSEADIEKALELQAERDGTLGELLVASKRLTSSQVTQILAAQLHLPFTREVRLTEVPEALLSKIPISFTKQNRILPISLSENGELKLLCSNPLDISSQDEIQFLFDAEPVLLTAPPEVVLSTINKVYDRATRQAEAAVQELEETGDTLKGDLEDEVVDLLDLEGDDEAPIIRLVNSLLTQAVKDRANDIHIEPFERELVVRFRVDGILYEIIRPPRRFQNSIISRIKIMAGLNIAEKRLPQDGRIRLKVAGRDFDIRVSSIPTSYGERIVMRLLDRSNVMKDLEMLGFSKENYEKMSKVIKIPHGIILVTGPTGSGKTSTLYACLSKINDPSLNILTIEDPVEYQLRGVGQVQVNAKIGLSFASGLRAFLRQDPDVIMVGEIRDRETAEISIQASLTGHLVLSTIHTNDAAGAITRLVDMQVEPFLVASSLVAVLAQRLVRTICPQCKESYKPTKLELDELGLGGRNIQELWRGAGCQRCQSTGYLGRLGIFELMLVDEGVRKKVLENTDSTLIKAYAREQGMVTLREDGAEKVLAGITTVEEVSRVTRDESNLSEV